MSIIGLAILIVIGLGLLPLALNVWERMTPKERLLVILVAAVAFMLLGCDTTGPEGFLWNVLRNAP